MTVATRASENELSDAEARGTVSQVREADAYGGMIDVKRVTRDEMPHGEWRDEEEDGCVTASVNHMTRVVTRQSIEERHGEDKDRQTERMLKSSEGGSIVELEIADTSSVTEVTRGGRPDAPIHLSLGRLESIDFDALLSRVPDSDSLGSINGGVQSDSSRLVLWERGESSSVMDQLARLSDEQLQDVVDPGMRQFAMPRLSPGLSANAGRESKKREEMRSWKEMVGKIEIETNERRTVVLDLRPNRHKVIVCSCVVCVCCHCCVNVYWLCLSCFLFV